MSLVVGLIRVAGGKARASSAMSAGHPLPELRRLLVGIRSLMPRVARFAGASFRREPAEEVLGYLNKVIVT